MIAVMGRRVVIVALSALTGGAIACTSLGGLTNGDADAGAGGDATSDAPLDANDAAPGDAGTFAASCAAYAAVSCDRLSGCFPALIQFNFGGPATCTARIEEACLSETGAPGTLATPADVDRCTADVAAQSCELTLAVGSPASCVAAGRRANGASCVSNLQCQSALCGGADAKGCGHCATPARVGDPCGDGCENHLVCASGSCVKPGELSASCDDAHPCTASLTCFDGACTAFLGKDAPCSAMTPSCDLSRGFACTAGKCEALAFAQSGQVCGNVNGTPTFCTAGVCASLDAGTGTCVGFAEPGEACNPSATPPQACIFITNCVAGQCVYPTQNLCAP
jgi:hypothetical protein